MGKLYHIYEYVGHTFYQNLYICNSSCMLVARVDPALPFKLLLPTLDKIKIFSFYIELMEGSFLLKSYLDSRVSTSQNNLSL